MIAPISERDSLQDRKTGDLTAEGRLLVRALNRLLAGEVDSYTVAELAQLRPATPRWAFCIDEADGGVMAFWDGMNWRRCTDRAIVSAA